MFIICELCRPKNPQWSAKDHDEYKEHLLSSEHQNNSMEKISYALENSSFQELFSIQEEDRCIVVRGSYPMDDLQEQNLLESFGDFGLLHDFVVLRWGPHFICAIIFESNDDVKNVMLRFKTTKNGNQVMFTPWTSDQWVLLRREIQIREDIRPGPSVPIIPKVSFSARALSSPQHIPNYEYTQAVAAPIEDSIFNRDPAIEESVNVPTSEYTFEDLLESVKMSSKEILRRNSLLEEIQTLIDREFPNCVLNPFGSMVTGIGDAKSKLEISFNPGGGDVPGFNKFTAVNQIRSILRTVNFDSPEKPFANIGQKQENSIPVISFLHSRSGLNCKIFVKHEVALSTSQLLNFYLSYDPRCRPFAHFIHHWAQFYNVFRTCNLSLYALNLMICVYLTNMEIIPSVFVLQQMSAQRNESKLHRIKKLVEWDISFCTDRRALRQYMSEKGYPPASESDLSIERILSLAKSFFEFYIKADLTENVICSYLAKVFPKSAFDKNFNALPPALFRFKQWCASARKDIRKKSMLHSVGHLSLQDPFDHGANVCKFTHGKAISIFEEACHMGLVGVTSFLNNEENDFSAIFSPILVIEKVGESLPTIEIEAPKYVDQHTELLLSQELNSILCSAYPFLTTRNPDSMVFFKPCRIFKQMFMQFFYGFTSHSTLRKLRLYLWMNFAQDFVVDYLTNCFFFHVKEKMLPPEIEDSLNCMPHYSRSRNSKSYNNGNGKKYKNTHSTIEDSDSDDDDNSDNDSIASMDEVDFDKSELHQDLIELERNANSRGQRLKAKMSDLLDAYNNWGEVEITRLYACECNDPIWENRETARAKLVTQPQSSYGTHPLTMETILSNMVKDTNETYDREGQCFDLYFAYKTFVRRENHYEGETINITPLLVMSLKSNSFQCPQDKLDHLLFPIQNVFARYTKYRLKRWLCD